MGKEICLPRRRGMHDPPWLPSTSTHSTKRTLRVWLSGSNRTLKVTIRDFFLPLPACLGVYFFAACWRSPASCLLASAYTFSSAFFFFSSSFNTLFLACWTFLAAFLTRSDSSNSSFSFVTARALRICSTLKSYVPVSSSPHRFSFFPRFLLLFLFFSDSKRPSLTCWLIEFSAASRIEDLKRRSTLPGLGFNLYSLYNLRIALLLIGVFGGCGGLLEPCEALGGVLGR